MENAGSMAQSSSHHGASFFYHHRHLITKVAFVIPIVLESMHFLYQAITHRKEIKAGAASLLEQLKKPLSIDPRKVAKVVFSALAIGAIGAASFYLLPGLFAASATLFGVSMVVKTAKHPTWIRETFNRLRGRIVQSFTIQKSEPLWKEGLRLAKNAVITSVVLIAIGVFCVAFKDLIAGTLFIKSAAGHFSLNPALVKFLTNKLVIVASYLAMATCTAYQSVIAFKEKRYLSAVFLLASAVMGFYGPIGILAGAKTIGLVDARSQMLAALPGLRVLTLFSMWLMADNLISLFGGEAGKKFLSNNVLISNPIAILGALVFGAALQFLNESLFTRKEVKKIDGKSSICQKIKNALVGKWDAARGFFESIFGTKKEALPIERDGAQVVKVEPSKESVVKSREVDAVGRQNLELSRSQDRIHEELIWEEEASCQKSAM
ncbi:MAG: hypothetical protein MRY21_02095 [Simkaniaceae bacterium]|nr:hypothetical protein [Simkaniaceae bacterium]